MQVNSTISTMDPTLQIMPIPTDEYPPPVMPIPEELYRDNKKKKIKIRRIKYQHSDTDYLTQGKCVCGSVNKENRKTESLTCEPDKNCNSEEVIQDPKQNRKTKYNREVKQANWYVGIKSSKLTCLLQYLVVGLVIMQSVVCSKGNTSKVRWDITSQPIIFGETAVLTCYIQSADACSAAVMWSRSDTYNLLALNNVSSNHKKYKVMMRLNCTENDLQIHDFNVEDLNKLYKCEHKFSISERNLTLNETIFERRFEDNGLEYFFHLTKNQLDGYIRLHNVYPSPKCHVQLRTQRLQVDEDITGNPFKMVTLKIMDKVIVESCKENITLQCKFGATTEEKKFTINKCAIPTEDKNDQTMTIVLVVCVVIVVMVVALGGVLIKCGVVQHFRSKCWQKGTAKEANEESTDDLPHSEDSKEISEMLLNDIHES